MNRLIIFLLIFLLIPLVSSQLLVVKDESVEISHPIRIDGAVDSSILANISVRNPDNILIAKGQMIFSSISQQHQITLNNANSSEVGQYNYCITATNGQYNNTACYYYDVTITGIKPTTSQAIIYLTLGLLTMALFGLSLFGAIKLPWKHKRDEKGLVVSKNDLRYLKLFLWFVTYILMIAITFSFKYVADASNLDAVANILEVINLFLMVFVLPVFILVFTIGIINVFQSKELEKLITRGVKVR